MKITAGTTSYILDIFVQDSSSTAGAGLAGLVYNTASLTAKYKRQGSATWTTISLATATAGTWASGGFIAAGSADDGDYELHLPDAVIASGVAWVAVSLQGAANMAPTKIRLGLTATNDQSATDGGITKIATIETSTTTTIPALIPTAGAIADQVWDEATAGHTTSGTYGGRVVRSTNSNVEVQITGSNHIAADVHEFQTGVITAAGTLRRMRSLRLHSLRMRSLRFSRGWHWRHRCSRHWIGSDSRWPHWLATVQIRRQRLRRIRLFSVPIRLRLITRGWMRQGREPRPH
jgi:hypothetical protein